MHKPWVDEITWPAPGGGTMRRVPEVIDTWFDSGAMPYAQWHYPFEHQAEFESHFPADYICEGIDQTRGWFYSLLAIATSVFDRSPYRNVIVNELVLDGKGQKMSKSRGNVVNPVGPDRGARGRRRPAVPAHLEPGLAAEAFRHRAARRDGRAVSQHAPEHLSVFCVVCRTSGGERATATAGGNGNGRQRGDGPADRSLDPRAAGRHGGGRARRV